MISDVPLSSLKLRHYQPMNPVQRKLTKRLFPSKGNRASDKLELIHSDFYGPMNTQAKGGFEYFVTFIDDYSKYEYVYLLRCKSECFEKFKEFKAKTKRLHDKYIKSL